MVLEAGVNRALKYSHLLFLFITFCFKEWSSVFHTEHFIFTETAAAAAGFFFFKEMNTWLHSATISDLCHFFLPCVNQQSQVCKHVTC